MDDIDYPYYNRRYYPPSSQTSAAISDNDEEEDDNSSSRRQLWEMCSNFAFVFTIFVIVVLQFKEPIVRWYQTTVFRLRYMSLGEYVIEQWWTSLDYIRGVWFMGLEILRNSADLLMPMHEAAGDGDDDALLLLSSSSSSSPPHRLQLRRRMNQQYHQLRNTPLPELLEDDKNNNNNNNHNDDEEDHHHLQTDLPTGVMGQAKERNGSVSSGRLRKWNQRELEPAFLKDSDYPAGWMVFHPILGVVSKEEADRYNSDESKRNGTPEFEEEKKTPDAVRAAAAMTPQSQSAFKEEENEAEEARVVVEHQYTTDDDNSSRDRSHSPNIRSREGASGIPHMRSIAASG